MLKIAFMAAITKRFVLRTAAAAQRYDGSAAQVIHVALRIHNFKIAVNFY